MFPFTIMVCYCSMDIALHRGCLSSKARKGLLFREQEQELNNAWTKTTYEGDARQQHPWCTFYLIPSRRCWSCINRVDHLSCLVNKTRDSYEHLSLPMPSLGIDSEESFERIGYR